MRRGRAAAAALSALALAAPTCATASASAAADPGIVVSGRRASVDIDLRRVRAVTRATEGEVVRIEAPVCPAVYGLPRALAEGVTARWRGDIAALGLQAAPTPCDPNLSVFVASGGARLVAGLFDRNPRLFDDLDLHARERLLGARGPVWTWRLTSARRRDGGPVQMWSSVQFSASEAPRPLARGAYVATNVEHGRLIAPVRRDVDAAFVVVDDAGVGGLTLQQLADASLMLGLSPADPERAAAAPGLSTIMTAFADRAQGRPSPAGLTAFDRAYLTALYSGGTGYSYEQKTLQMAIRLRTALAKSPSPNEPSVAKAGRD